MGRSRGSRGGGGGSGGGGGGGGGDRPAAPPAGNAAPQNQQQQKQSAPPRSQAPAQPKAPQGKYVRMQKIYICRSLIELVAPFFFFFFLFPIRFVTTLTKKKCKRSSGRSKRGRSAASSGGGGGTGGEYGDAQAAPAPSSTPAPASSGLVDLSRYDAIPVTVSGKHTPLPPMETFSAMAETLGADILRNLERCGYKEPTPIQRHSVPNACAGSDLMACAQTGSGKTAGFLLPALARVVPMMRAERAAGTQPRVPSAALQERRHVQVKLQKKRRRDEPSVRGPLFFFFFFFCILYFGEIAPGNFPPLTLPNNETHHQHTPAHNRTV
jgi:hypothetical protein